ncbi:MAG: hypothetical protein R3B60_02345 [Candidatus Paceibacterota bacterium]
MIFNSLFFQILLAGLAIAIAIVYVNPSFKNIGDLQFAIAEYKKERDNVAKFNTDLRDLAKKINSISEADQQALLKYMPDTVDEVSVSRDIFNISLMSGVVMNDISVSDGATNNRNNNPVEEVVDPADQHKTPPVPHAFSASVTGEYEDIKNFLLLLEESNYPLEIRNLSISSSNGGSNQESSTLSNNNDLSAEVEIVTYSRI